MFKLLIQNRRWRTTESPVVVESCQRWSRNISKMEGRCLVSSNRNFSIKTLAVKGFQGQEITELQAIKAKSKNLFTSLARVLQPISIKRQLDSAISIKSVEMLMTRTQPLTK